MMGAIMAFSIQNKPQPFGLVQCVTPGVLVQLAINLPNLSPVVAQVTDQIPCNKISINAPAGNAGKVYIGFSGFVRATYVGVLFVLSAGQSVSITPMLT